MVIQIDQWIWIPPFGEMKIPKYWKQQPKYRKDALKNKPDHRRWNHLSPCTVMQLKHGRCRVKQEATQRKSNANGPMLGCSDATEWIECTNDRKFREDTPYGGSKDWIDTLQRNRDRKHRKSRKQLKYTIWRLERSNWYPTHRWGWEGKEILEACQAMQWMSTWSKMVSHSYNEVPTLQT